MGVSDDNIIVPSKLTKSLSSLYFWAELAACVIKFLLKNLLNTEVRMSKWKERDTSRLTGDSRHKVREAWHDARRDARKSGELPSGGGGGGCFIATVAFGSNLEYEVVVLRDFRDNCLLRVKVGRYFVNAYYLISPPVARIVAKSRLLKFMTRTCIRIALAICGR